MRNICVLAVILMSVITPAYAMADELSFPHILVAGHGEVKVTPNIADFSVVVTETTLDTAGAKHAVDKSVDSFIHQLTQNGVSEKDIKSSNLYLVPQYHYPADGRAELLGYRATRQVEVTVRDLTRLDSYLNKALSENINQIKNIRFGISDPEKYQQQARMQAVKDAQNKAASLVSGFGRQLGELWSINYSSARVQPVQAQRMTLSSQVQGKGYELSAPVVVRESVNVIYKIK